MSREIFTDTVRSYRGQALAATIHKACPNCNAPGVYTDEPSIKAGWSGCYVEPSDERHGQPVGARCPNCNLSRTPSLIDHLGVIWRRVFVP